MGIQLQVKSSNRTPVIGHSRDRAPITCWLGLDTLCWHNFGNKTIYSGNIEHNAGIMGIFQQKENHNKKKN